MAVAIVTGASRGIGARVLLRLSEAGYSCVSISRTPSELGIEAHFVSADLSTDAGIEVAIQDLTEYTRKCGDQVKLLVNNAGGGLPQRLEELTAASIVQELKLNFVSCLMLCQAIRPMMKAAGGGSIINVGSTAGRRGVPYLHTYGAAKAAISVLTQSLAVELASEKIRVNCVCPGAVNTSSAKGSRRLISRFLGLPEEEYEDRMMKAASLETLIDPDDVARTIIWLAETACGVNGQTINVCGTAVMT